MLLFPSCDKQHVNAELACPQRQFAPARIDGVLAWAPELAKQNDSVPESSFEGLARVEAGGFWFRLRNAIVHGD